MVGILLSAALFCVAALAVGQVVLRLCGWTETAWAAPAVGLSVLMVLASPALHIPGRTTTTFVVIALVTVGCVAACAARPELRPPLGGLLAVLPLAVLVLIPFVAAGHGGVLGVSFNNDMGAHLRMAESFRTAAGQLYVEVPSDYPLGPHALVGAITTGLGIRLEEAFTGFTIALSLLLAWTALGAVRRPSWWGRVATGVLVAAPALLVGYYGQGSFKEIAEVLLTVAVLVLLLQRPQPVSLARWVPVALLLAGTLSVYSFAGIAWPLAVIAPWVLIEAVRALREGGLRGAWRRLTPQLPAVAVAVAALVVVLVPQLPRLYRFFLANTADELAVSPLGNLVGPLRFWQAFGVWSGPDYRIVSGDAIELGIWIGVVVVLAIVGAVISARRGELLLIGTTAFVVLLWVYADHAQSPYIAAKSLVVASPIVMLLVARALVEQDWLPAGWWRRAGALLALLLVVKVVASDVPMLRASKVGPTARMHELQALQPSLAGHDTLFLGNDDFLTWELQRVRHSTVVLGFQTMPTRDSKRWAYGQALDFDSVDDATLNRFDRFVVPRDVVASVPPPGLELIHRGENYDTYARVGTVPARQTLPGEDAESAKVLQCKTPAGRAIVEGGGVAMIREPAVTATLAPIPAGDTATTELNLTPGRWDLAASYASEHPVEISIPGKLQETLSANLDRPGPRWPIGTIDVASAGPVRVVVHATETFLTPDSSIAYVSPIFAVRQGSARMVPIRRACGRLVDWYQSRR